MCGFNNFVTTFRLYLIKFHRLIIMFLLKVLKLFSINTASYVLDRTGLGAYNKILHNALHIN